MIYLMHNKKCTVLAAPPPAPQQARFVSGSKWQRASAAAIARAGFEADSETDPAETKARPGNFSCRCYAHFRQNFQPVLTAWNVRRGIPEQRCDLSEGTSQNK